MKKTNANEILNDFKIEELEQRFELKPWLKKHNPKDVGCIIIINLKTVPPGNGQDGVMLLDETKADFMKVSGGYSVDGQMFKPDANGVFYNGTEAYVEDGKGGFERVN